MTSSTRKRIIFTGGSGEAGRHCVEYLMKQGHTILNLDTKPLDIPGVHTLITDLTKAGEVYSALSHTLFTRDDYINTPLQFPPVDAVISFAAFPRPLTVPDNRVFLDNVTITFNVIEAACKLGIRKIILASSQTVYGNAFSQGEAEWEEFPIFEDSHGLNPTDAYGLSKVCAENTGRSYAKRFGIDIYALRPSHVIVPGSYSSIIPRYLDNPRDGFKIAWSYSDARDLGQICHRCVLTDGLGWQVFNAVNDSALAKNHIMDIVRRNWPDLKITRLLGESEAPTNNEKAKRLLGFQEKHDWRKEVELEARGSK